jgi:hypothetical protein
MYFVVTHKRNIFIADLELILSRVSRIIGKGKGNGKGKAYPRTGHESPERE